MKRPARARKKPARSPPARSPAAGPRTAGKPAAPERTPPRPGLVHTAELARRLGGSVDVRRLKRYIERGMPVAARALEPGVPSGRAKAKGGNPWFDEGHCRWWIAAYMQEMDARLAPPGPGVEVRPPPGEAGPEREGGAGGVSGPTLTQARAVNEGLKAERLRLDLAARQGRMIERRDAEEAWAQHMQAVRQRLDVLPARAAAAVLSLGAALKGHGAEARVREALRELVDEALEMLARNPLGEQA